MPLQCNALITHRLQHFPHLAQTQVFPQPSAMPCRKSSYVFHAFTDVSSTSNFDQTQVCSCLISRGRWCRNTTSKWPTNMLVVCAPHCPHVCISLINFEDWEQIKSHQTFLKASDCSIFLFQILAMQYQFLAVFCLMATVVSRRHLCDNLTLPDCTNGDKADYNPTGENRWWGSGQKILE